MNYKMLCKFLGFVLIIEAAFLSVPLLVALIYSENPLPYLYTIFILFLIAAPTLRIKPKNKRIYAKDGLICVALSWVLLSLFGALPFVFSGAIPNYIDAVFETVSGFTTTGSTILREVESLPRGILFWRSFTHWIGGMGILVFMLALLKGAEGNVIFLMRAETPGPQKGKLVPKLKDSSLILYVIYLAFTVIEIIALLCTGMPLYDSLVNSFGTMGTGGFSVLNNSIAGYNNPAAEWIMAIFLFIAGVNYNIYFFLIVKKWSAVKKNEELRVYILITLISTALIAGNLFTSGAAVYESLPRSIRDAFFQVTSIMSTAGFTTFDYTLWPNLSQGIIIILMFIGACAGSTAGGFKISRLIIICKNLRREIRHYFKPNAVEALRIDGDVLEEKTAKSAMNYLGFYSLIMAVSFLIVSLEGKDLLTNFSAVLTCFNNVGPGFGEVFASFASYSYFSKIILTLDMLFGRLEIMPMLILMYPAAWRKN